MLGRMWEHYRGRVVAVGILPIVFSVGLAIPAASQQIEWDGVPGRDLTLFYPGQSSWEWQLTESDHSGGPKIRKGKSCISCHEGEESKIGELIVAGKKLDSRPIPGRRATIPLNVKITHDGNRLYVRLEWPSAESTTGSNSEHAAMATIMLDDGSVRSARTAGCWGTCHDDLVEMPSAAEGSELSKYLTSSRTRIRRSGGGENFKPLADIDKLLSSGAFMEYWQARLTATASVKAADGYILKDRHENEAPAVDAIASRADGRWSVILVRKLILSSTGHKDIVPGKKYTLGFAIHDGHTEGRFHHVSFERTLMLDSGDADFIASQR